MRNGLWSCISSWGSTFLSWGCTLASFGRQVLSRAGPVLQQFPTFTRFFLFGHMGMAPILQICFKKWKGRDAINAWRCTGVRVAMLFTPATHARFFLKAQAAGECSIGRVPVQWCGSNIPSGVWDTYNAKMKTPIHMNLFCNFTFTGMMYPPKKAMSQQEGFERFVFIKNYGGAMDFAIQGIQESHVPTRRFWNICLYKKFWYAMDFAIQGTVSTFFIHSMAMGDAIDRSF